MSVPLLSGSSYLHVLLNLRNCDVAAWQNASQFVVDVDGFEAHIACSGSLKSAQVIPYINQVGRTPRILWIDVD